MSTRSDETPASAVEYVYMFERNNAPTKQLDALLRAIARHIIVEIGDKQDAQLTPSKLAAFYRAVGGDYDSLFVDMPHSSLSYIWQVTGCQHSLQPTTDDFAAPSIPALTFRGFSRWESLEILLGPEEHVPFLQYAVRNWALKHPDTGEPFPSHLPVDVFPSRPDTEVDRWHKSCADRLKSEAASSAEDAPPSPKPSSPAANHTSPPQFAYVHLNPFRPPSPRSKAPKSDHFSRPMPFAHVPAHPSTRHAGTRRPGPSPPRDETAEEHARRKSFSDYASPKANTEPLYHSYSSAYLDPGFKRPAAPRRHSHPRHHSDSSDSDVAPQPTSHKMRQRHHPPSPPPPPSSVRRFVPPTAPPPPPAAAGGPSSFRSHRSDMHPDEAKRRNGPSPLGSLRNKLTETVSSMLPGGMTADRPRSGLRQNANNEAERVRKSRDQFQPAQPSRLNRSYSDDDSNSSDGPVEEDVRRRRRVRDERDRERFQRGRPRDPDRARQDDRDSGGRRDRPSFRRPEAHRRTSSLDRQGDHPAWDARDRARRDDRRKWGRRSPEEGMATATVGAAGRRYAEPAYS
ncbi:hypothetical protein RJ55_05038 [Drechmeria coniospora]|nr:hypothetical protein RJ55_05038 [Drechmeria coniospora]